MSRRTPQREAIRSALHAAGRPLSPQEVLDFARNSVPALGQATVYRTLALLVESGDVAPVDLPGEARRYELREAALRHHHHFRCDSCASVYDIQGCPGGLRDMLPRGFRLRNHEIILYGVCATCQNA